VYNHDLRPLVRVPSLSPTWERLCSRCEFNIRPSLELQVTFDYVFVSTAPVYFAFYYPFSYADCQRLLNNIERALPGIGAVTGLTADSVIAASAGSPAASATAKAPGGSILPAAPGATAPPAAPSPPGGGSSSGGGGSADGIYYHRELMCYTPDGRRLELLTITSRAGILAEREPVIDGLFPDVEVVPRVHRFRGKPGVFVSARVHPGETSASYMVHGLIAFLLQVGGGRGAGHCLRIAPTHSRRCLPACSPATPTRARSAPPLSSRSSPCSTPTASRAATSGWTSSA